MTHPRCRCNASPILNNRRVPFPTGEQWLESLPASEQRAILGPGRYNALSDGRISLTDMIGPERQGLRSTAPLRLSLS